MDIKFIGLIIVLSMFIALIMFLIRYLLSDSDDDKVRTEYDYYYDDDYSDL